MVGRVNRTGHLTGIRIAYIYPDYATAMVGTFKDGIMLSGQEAEITGVFEDDAGIKVPILSQPKGHVHLRQVGTFDQLCSGK